MSVQLLAITPNAEQLIEEAGRTCYLSFEKMSEDSYKRFIRMIVRNGHHSVLEHASATFRVMGGSRSFTHQVVRHRLCSFSQQSQRYVNEGGFAYIFPPSIVAIDEALQVYNDAMIHMQAAYELLLSLGIPKEDSRMVLPNGVESEIVISANFRQWRHVFTERCAKAAQWEIRGIMMECLRSLKEQVPVVFEDFVIDEKNGTACVLKQ